MMGYRERGNGAGNILRPRGGEGGKEDGRGGGRKMEGGGEEKECLNLNQ